MSWEEKRLGDVLTLKRGYDLTEAQRRAGEIPVVSSSGITGSHNVAMVKGPGVVTGRYGTMGEVFYVDGDFWPHNTALYVQDFKGNDPRFVSYFLKHALRGASSTKAAVPGVNRNDLHERKVLSPDYKTQLRIVERLLPIDDLIENNRRRIALLEQSARLLYREWFVHLRFPGHEHVKVVDGAPEGWATKAVAEMADLYRGISYSSDQLVSDDGKPFVNLKCMDRLGGFRASGLKTFKGQHKAHHAVAAGDIVCAVTDMTRDALIVAQAARVPRVVDEDAVFSMDMVKLVPKPAFSAEWFYALLRFSSFSFEVREKATGATVLHLRPKHIEEWRTAVPPEALRKEFAEYAEPWLELMDCLEVQNEKLRQARDLLLPRLMSGQIQLNDMSYA